MRNALVLRCLLLVLAGFAKPAFSEQWTDSDIRAMPPYCAARLHKQPEQNDHWRAVLGPDYLHTHHYCYAIGFINRYYAARTSRSKAFNLQSAFGNLNYMVAHASPTYSLMPEVYLKRGLVQSLSKKDGAAIVDILKAIELNPQLVRAYSMAADHYVKLSKKDEALKLATEGLRHNPESTVLQRLYAKLGGQLPYPEPVASQDAPAAVTTTESSPVVTESATDNKTDLINPAQATPGQETESKASVEAPAESYDTTKIGSPSNPWCRFCPPEPNQ